MEPNPVTDPKVLFPRTSYAIVGAFYDVYNEFGHGFLESHYSRALEELLVERGHQVDREFPIQVFFRGRPIGFHRCDMLVDKCVIVEIKACEFLTGAHKRQLRNYLSAMGLELGILLHFGPKANSYRVLGPRPRTKAGEDSA